ncbi:MAG: molybdopterin-dependent oxidoreductase [Deltaproteobacteria bacterium]|nr:molybdopterin-dependent oxidoreductase [Deltaproteobacteria bacterium]
MKMGLRRAGAFLREREGRHSEELKLAPSGFGLAMVPTRITPDGTVTATCGYCSVGCGLKIHLRQGEAINLSPARDYPVNLGMACPKGWESLTPLKARDRAVAPLLREGSGALRRVSWDQAMRALVTRFKGIQERHGKAAVAFLSTGQIVTEEMAFLGALAKFGMGILHGDGNTRQCMATTVVAYKESLGFDAPPLAYKDLEESDVIFLWGSNLCTAHPILWERVVMNRHKPTVVVVDPRKTETASAASVHVALRPKSDLYLLYGIANVLIRNDWIDHAFIAERSVGFEAFREHVLQYSPEWVSEHTGVPVKDIRALASIIHRGKRVSFWWTMGVNQGHQAVRTAQGIIDLALMTGNIGRPGTGPNSITGQCNAMGSRLFSNTTNLLGGHDFARQEHRHKVARVLGIDEGRIPRDPGLAYDQVLDEVRAGRIKGLWIIGTNPVHSWIDRGGIEELRRKLEFLVVQDMYAGTDTARIADLVLPAAGWGEKEGTFINSERRISTCKKVARAPGEALADFSIFRLVAEYWGVADLFQKWSSPESVFQLLKELSKGQPCDLSGIQDYAMLDEKGGIQWPFPEGEENAEKERRLFEDHRFFHEDGRARFFFEEPRPVPEPTSGDYPLVLMTGRGSSSQWHTQTRTNKSAVLRKLYPDDVYVEMNPDDAAARGVEDGATVTIWSRRGKIQARALITSSMQPGHVFIPMHYEETNELTCPAFDPLSRQPAYKMSAVQVQRST